MTAEAMASALGIPYFAVSHWKDALTARLTDDIAIVLCCWCQAVTRSCEILGWPYERWAQLDDAAGEAFDKGAALLGLAIRAARD